LFEAFQEEEFGMYVDEDVDLETVESHTRVEIDEETGEPIRQQMVYVDEVSCIGCYQCAMIAQSTFFMEEEHGRARVFEQWGDDDETVATAIESCPVDCIHYIPYDELVKLEVERRGVMINNAARLVSQSDTCGPSCYSGPQEISGDFGSRCNNCPSKGCKDCPMFGIGKNPAFEKRERERLEKAGKKRLKKQMQEAGQSVDL